MESLECMAKGVWPGLRAVWKLGSSVASLEAGKSVSWCLGKRMVV